MPIDVVTLSEAERDRILAIEEGHFTDLKAIEIKPSKLTEVVAAFANSDGGELYIGIDEIKPSGIRVWRGFADQEDANGHLQVFEGLFPLGQDFEYTFLQCLSEPGLVLQVQIRKTRDIKRASDGLPYIRRGAQKLPVSSPDRMKRLEYNKGITSFETESLDIPKETITESVEIDEFMTFIVPHTEPERWLRKQLLIRGDRPVVAGVLLLAEEPQAALPKRCGIKVYRYVTREREGFREALAFQPLTIEGCLYKQITSAVHTTTQTVEEIKKLGGEALQSIKYPNEAIHEIITNAVLHRDYSVPDDIHIRVFEDRIEVESPGRLPAHITVDNILKERAARNGSIVRLLNKFPDPPNKDVGEGLNTAFRAMVNLGLRTPTIQENENSVRVTIKHEPLASPETIILDYLDTHETIRNSEARKMCFINADYQMKAIFNRLEARGLIEKVPGTRTSITAYRKPRKSVSESSES